MRIMKKYRNNVKDMRVRIKSVLILFFFYFQGTCQDVTERFYFDETKGQCQAFIFKGCEGNQNNFITMAECESHCRSFIK